MIKQIQQSIYDFMRSSFSPKNNQTISQLNQSQHQSPVLPVAELQSHLLNLWTSYSVDETYQNLFLIYLQTFKNKKQQIKEIENQIKKTYEKNSLYFLLQQNLLLRTEIKSEIEEQIVEETKNQTMKKSQSKADIVLKELCHKLKNLRRINLLIVQNILKIFEDYKVTRQSSLGSVGKKYIEIFMKIDVQNEFIKESFLNEFVLFQKGYDPFFLVHYEEIMKSANPSTLKKHQPVAQLFDMNISYVYRLMRAQQKMLKYMLLIDDHTGTQKQRKEIIDRQRLLKFANNSKKQPISSSRQSDVILPSLHRNDRNQFTQNVSVATTIKPSPLLNFRKSHASRNQKEHPNDSENMEHVRKKIYSLRPLDAEDFHKSLEKNKSQFYTPKNQQRNHSLQVLKNPQKYLEGPKPLNLKTFQTEDEPIISKPNQRYSSDNRDYSVEDNQIKGKRQMVSSQSQKRWNIKQALKDRRNYLRPIKTKQTQDEEIIEEDQNQNSDEQYYVKGRNSLDSDYPMHVSLKKQKLADLEDDQHSKVRFKFVRRGQKKKSKQQQNQKEKSNQKRYVRQQSEEQPESIRARKQKQNSKRKRKAREQQEEELQSFRAKKQSKKLNERQKSKRKAREQQEEELKDLRARKQRKKSNQKSKSKRQKKQKRKGSTSEQKDDKRRSKRRSKKRSKKMSNQKSDQSESLDSSLSDSQFQRQRNGNQSSIQHQSSSGSSGSFGSKSIRSSDNSDNSESDYQKSKRKKKERAQIKDNKEKIKQKLKIKGSNKKQSIKNKEKNQNSPNHRIKGSQQQKPIKKSKNENPKKTNKPQKSSYDNERERQNSQKQQSQKSLKSNKDKASGISSKNKEIIEPAKLKQDTKNQSKNISSNDKKQDKNNFTNGKNQDKSKDNQIDNKMQNKKIENHMLNQIKNKQTESAPQYDLSRSASNKTIKSQINSPEQKKNNERKSESKSPEQKLNFQNNRSTGKQAQKSQKVPIGKQSHQEKQKSIQPATSSNKPTNSQSNLSQQSKIKMVPGKVTFLQFTEYIKSKKIHPSYLQKFNQQIPFVLKSVENTQTYLNEFHLNDTLSTVVLCSPTASGNLVIYLWAPIQNVCDEKSSQFFFKKYLDYLQQQTTFKSILYCGGEIPELRNQNFQLQSDKNFIRKRVNAIKRQNFEFEYFFSMQASNISFIQTSADSLLFSDQITPLNQTNSWCSSKLLNAKEEGISEQFEEEWIIEESIKTIMEANMILQKDSYDTFEVGVEKIKFNNINMSRCMLSRVPKYGFIANEGFMIVDGKTLVLGDSIKNINKIQLLNNVNLYFGDGFKTVQQMVDYLTQKRLTVKQQDGKFAFKMFSKQLYGRYLIKDAQLDKSKAYYCNWDINFAWRDQISGKIIHDFTSVQQIYGPQNFMLIVEMKGQLALGAEILKEDLLY